MPLSPRVPDLGAMDMLLSVARLGSLGKAAAEHGASQQAVSSRIRRMERLLGVALIERTSNGSALTAAGSLVADWAREVVGAAASRGSGESKVRALTEAGAIVVDLPSQVGATLSQLGVRPLVRV